MSLHPPAQEHCLSLVSAVEPMVRDLVFMTALVSGPGGPGGDGGPGLVVRAELVVEDEAVGVRLQACSPSGGTETCEVPLEGCCLTCALRDVIATLVRERTRLDPDGSTTVLLPSATELVHLVPGLAQELADEPVRLAGVTHVVDTATAARCLLDHVSLDEVVSTCVPGEERCVGELHANGVGYADLVLALGDDGVGAELVEHLRADDSLLVPGLDEDWHAVARSLTHDPDAALVRVHPATTRAWGGPCDYGVRTLDLHSHMPFHPTRLREMARELAGQGLLARGCFWLPSRPGRVCAWEVCGGIVSMGDAGTWADLAAWQEAAPAVAQAAQCLGAPGLDAPRCHLIVTGVADEVQVEAVKAAFAAVLLRPDELDEAMAWVGASDGLEDWLGE